MKKAEVLFLMIICFIFLFGCNMNVEKSEKEILNDIMTPDSFFEKYDVEIQSSNITKRQTNKEQKTDYVWIDITGQAEQFHYYASYELTYVLYNDGWLLEEFEEVDTKYEASHVPENELKEMAEFILSTMCTNYEYMSLEQVSVNKVILYYTVTKQISDYLSIQSEAELTAHFSPSNGWSINDDSVEIINEKEFWDIDGKWGYQDEEIEINLEILEYDIDTDIVKLNYSCSTSYNSAKNNEIISYAVGRSHGGHRSYKYPYVRSSKYVPEKSGLKIGETVAEIYLAGDEYSIYNSETNSGIYFCFWDGDEWYYRWLTKQ